MTRQRLTSLLIIITIIFVSPLQAQNLIRSGFGKKHRPLVGFRAGIINSGNFHVTSKTINLNDATYETKMGLTWGVFFDIPMGPKLMTELAIDVHDIQVRNKRTPMLNAGLSLMFPVYKEISRVAWRPKIGIGYAYLGEVDPLNLTTYTTINGGMEIVFYGTKSHAFLLELAVYGAPWGGNSEVDIDFGQVMLIRAGVLY